MRAERLRSSDIDRLLAECVRATGPSNDEMRAIAAMQTRVEIEEAQERRYTCRQCGHGVEDHPPVYDWTDWQGSHHAKTPCTADGCDCAFYVPRS